MEMEFLPMEDHSLWDPMEDPQLAAEYLDFDYLRNDWVKGDEGDKLIDGTKYKIPAENEENLLLDDTDLCNWMETKFDFEDGTFQFHSLDDIELLLREGSDVTLHESSNCSQNVDLESSSSSGSHPNVLAETGGSESINSPETIVLDIVQNCEAEDEQVSKTRRKPYSRAKSGGGATEFRKSRKRTQNRNAAIRYRTKKREEAEVMAAEELGLKETNEGLNKRVNDLTSEIKYLKNLLKELIQVKSK